MSFPISYNTENKLDFWIVHYNKRTRHAINIKSYTQFQPFFLLLKSTKKNRDILKKDYR